MKYAIKYLRLNYNPEVEILIPKKLVKGDIREDIYFETNNEIIPYITNDIDDSKYIIGNAYSLDELRKLYFCENESEEEVINFFFMDMQEKMPIIKNGVLKTLDTFEMFDDNSEEKTLYDCIDGESCVIFNKNVINKLQRVENMDDLHQIFLEYGDRLASFDENRSKDGIESILVKDGHVVSVDKRSDYHTLDYLDENLMPKKSNNYEDNINSDVSVKGLYDHLKADIKGHDNELKKIATIMVMNYLSNPYYGTESILIPGPTGVGKTATFKSVSEYFNIPFKNINTCNLVPEGIVGTTIEDEFSSLIDACDGDIKKAEKAILVFDEFDKIGVDNLDIKASLSNVFLKALEGASFPINRQLKETRIYNTVMASKVCLGTFEQAYRKEKNSIGFGSGESKEAVFDRDMLVSKGYFNKELLSRIGHFIPYDNLSYEDKLKAILEAKHSLYLLKKERFENDFGITIEGDDDFAMGIMNALKENDQSVRDINNIISDAFVDIEYEVLDNRGSYKKLVLTKDTIKDHSFNLK